MRRVVYLAPLTALMLVVVACGGGSDRSGSGAGAGDESVAQLIVASADTTTEAGSARLAGTLTFEGTDESLTLELSGAFDLQTGDAVLSMDAAALGVPGLDGAQLEVLLVNHAIYVNIGDLAEADDLGLPEGTRWLSLDVSDVGALADELGANFDGSGVWGGDLTDALAALRGASGEVTESGEREVRGETVTCYEAEVDPALALDRLPADARGAAGDGLDLFGDSTFPVEVCLDEEGRLRFMSATVDAEGFDLPGASTDATATIEYEIYDFGVAVDVEAPAADEIVDLFSLLAGAFAELEAAFAVT